MTFPLEKNIKSELDIRSNKPGIECSRFLGKMGCFDNEDGKARQASRDLERRLAQDEAIEKKKIKLLLLGAGESGKSTIFKQMRVLYGAPLTEQEKKEVSPIVYVNTISSMKLLVNQTALWGYQDQVRFY
jgi:hypothetical protein